MTGWLSCSRNRTAAEITTKWPLNPGFFECQARQIVTNCNIGGSAAVVELASAFVVKCLTALCSEFAA